MYLLKLGGNFSFIEDNNALFKMWNKQREAFFWKLAREANNPTDFFCHDVICFRSLSSYWPRQFALYQYSANAKTHMSVKNCTE